VSSVCGGGGRISSILKYSEIPRRQEFMKIKWPYINVEMALRKILTVQNATEQRNLGTLHRVLNEIGENRLIKYINKEDKTRNC